MLRNRQEDFMAVEDAERRNPERLARLGKKLPHHDAGITDVRAFFIGAGPDQLDLSIARCRAAASSARASRVMASVRE